MSSDLKRPFLSTVRSRSSSNVKNSSGNRFLPKLPSVTNQSLERNQYKDIAMNNRQMKLPSVEPRPFKGPLFNKKPRRLSHLETKPKEKISVDAPIEKPPEISPPEPSPRLNFGVAFRISKFLGHFKRRNSPEKLKTLKEYETMENDNHYHDNVATDQKIKVEIDSPRDPAEVQPPGVVPESSKNLESKPQNVERTISKLTLQRVSSNTSLNHVNKFHHQNNWNFLRNRLVQAKMSDVFSNIKFYVNGKSIRALRCIGEGGYSKVYDVFDDSNQLLALKVVDLNDVKVKEELMAEINFLRRLRDSEKVINMIDYEVKKDVQGLPFHDDDPDRGLFEFDNRK